MGKSQAPSWLSISGGGGGHCLKIWQRRSFCPKKLARGDDGPRKSACPFKGTFNINFPSLAAFTL